jgi:nitrogen fixation/metabolism regulation signal transduction histidine kinase
VRRLTEAFDGMLAALADSERRHAAAQRIAAWQEVARYLAHEVRNPLSPIQLAVQNLRRAREKGALPFERAFDQETAVILEEVESLRRLVDEFSLFARLPPLAAVRCDLRQIAAQALSLHAPRIAEGGVRLEFDETGPPAWIHADPEQIGRVLKNVIANALCALEPVAERSLALEIRRATSPRGAVLVLEVRDSGVGLSREAAPRAFEPYFTTRPEKGGTGLGLAIAYRIVTEHGGRIEIDGTPGRGAVVAIELPVERPKAAHDGIPGATLDAHHPHR